MWTEVRYLNRRGPSIALTTCGTPHEFLPACGKSLAENDMIDDMIMGDIQLGNLANWLLHNDLTRNRTSPKGSNAVRAKTHVAQQSPWPVRVWRQQFQLDSATPVAGDRA